MLTASVRHPGRHDQFVVILVEVALALVISFALERSTTEVDLTGGDLIAFCAEVRTLREQIAEAPTVRPARSPMSPAPA